MLWTVTEQLAVVTRPLGVDMLDEVDQVTVTPPRVVGQIAGNQRRAGEKYFFLTFYLVIATTQSSNVESLSL